MRWRSTPPVFKFLLINLLLKLNLTCVSGEEPENTRQRRYRFGGGYYNNPHLFDLSGLQISESCINHTHNYPTYAAPNNLTIIRNPGSRCFIIHNEYGCQGAHLRFFGATQKTLWVESFQMNRAEPLWNFDIAPHSISSCPVAPDALDPVLAGASWGLQSGNGKNDLDSKCGSNYGISVKELWNLDNQRKTIAINVTETCTNVPNWKDFYKLDNNIPHHYNHDIHLHLDHGSPHYPYACIETYPKSDCKGDQVTYELALPPSQTDLQIIKQDNSIKIWHKMNMNIVDTDLMSVRKCGCSGGKGSLPQKEPLSQDQELEIENRINHKGENETRTCNFTDCQKIKNFLNSDKGPEAGAGGKCYFIFNSPNCNDKPILGKSQVDKEELRMFGKKHWDFGNWALALCVEGDEDDDCVTPILRNASLANAFALGRRKGKAPGQKDKTSVFNSVEVIVLAVVSVLAFIMLVVVLLMGYLLWKKKRHITAIRRGIVPKQRGAMGHHHQIDPIEQNDYVNDIVGLERLCRAIKNEGYELDRDAFDMGNIRNSDAIIIGVGEFSIAFKGKLTSTGKTVAVKTLKTGQATARSVKGILKECRTLMECTGHEGIVKFVGVCVENMKKGEIFVVMEYCDFGSLKSFLVQHRSNFNNLVEKGEFKAEEDLSNHATKSLEGGPPTKFNTFQLLKWSLEVADAMEYLATRKIIHISLSARNVLLDVNYSPKIADFRLAIMPSEGSVADTNYRAYTIKERSIPWRCLAVESLLHDIFSTESDVWTFGIFMWELFTLGGLPYSEHYYGGDFTMCLKHGYRLLKPELATIQSYELMLICWYDAPEKRPSFSKLKAKLRGMIPKAIMNNE